jgi:hypothetical protein
MSTDREPGWAEKFVTEAEKAARERGPVDEAAVAALRAAAIRLDREQEDWEDYPECPAP